MLYSHTKGYTCTLESFNFVGPIFLDCGSFSFSCGYNFVDASFFLFSEGKPDRLLFVFVENVNS